MKPLEIIGLMLDFFSIPFWLIAILRLDLPEINRNFAFVFGAGLIIVGMICMMMESEV